jgi:hypothetical protein
MASARGPTEAIAELLAEELRRLIRGLPDYLRDSEPEQLSDETRHHERETPG